MAVLVARETKSLLIGEAATPESQEKIRNLVGETEGAKALMNLRTMQLGDDEFLAALKIQWDAGLSMADVIQRTNDLEQRIRTTIPRARYVFVEADTFDPEKAKLPEFPS